MPTFLDAVVDPLINAIACSSAVARPQQAENFRARQTELQGRALLGGPDALTASEQGMLLDDPYALSDLHLAVWTMENVHPTWRNEFQGYRSPSPVAKPVRKGAAEKLAGFAAAARTDAP
jgi:membrane glycosyltransferase